MFEITLSDGTIIEILTVNFSGNSVDWKRKEGYTGACMSPVTFTGFENIETDIKAALEAELGLSQP